MMRYCRVVASSAAGDTSLPTFTRPPVVEVVLGLMFRPLPLGAIHLAQLHRLWSSTYPRVEEHPAIPANTAPGFFLQMNTAPDLRFWFISDTSGRLIQVQKDRIILNWRWQNAEQEYPRYSALRKELVARVSDFRAFLESSGVGPFDPIASEVTYINVIGSERYIEFHEALNFVADQHGLPSVPVEASLQLKFDTADLLDRDSNFIVTATRDTSRDPAPIGLQLSSHSQVGNPDDFIKALDRSHELVVSSFREMTTSVMHENWGLQ